jgi:hypothetical protein
VGRKKKYLIKIIIKIKQNKIRQGLTAQVKGTWPRREDHNRIGSSQNSQKFNSENIQTVRDRQFPPPSQAHYKRVSCLPLPRLHGDLDRSSHRVVSQFLYNSVKDEDQKIEW